MGPASGKGFHSREQLQRLSIGLAGIVAFNEAIKHGSR